MRFIVAGLVFVCVFNAAAAAENATQAAAPEAQAATGDKVDAGKAEPEKPAAPPEAAGYFDAGFGLGMQNYSEHTPIGWDGIAGYQWLESDHWRGGVQLHWLEGTISSGTSFRSTGLWLTANPKLDFLRWFQFKAGIVHDSYSSTSTQYASIPTYPYSTTQTQTTAWGGNGLAAGVAFVMPFDRWQLHLLDVERHFVAGREYNTYTISIVVLIEIFR